jgi:hypothetical protein
MTVRLGKVRSLMIHTSAKRRKSMNMMALEAGY